MSLLTNNNKNNNIFLDKVLMKHAIEYDKLY